MRATKILVNWAMMILPIGVLAIVAIVLERKIPEGMRDVLTGKDWIWKE